MQVTLSDDFAQHDDAAEGPLKPGEFGTLLENDKSSKPYHVQSASGKSWWYKKQAIIKYKVLHKILFPSYSQSKIKMKLHCYWLFMQTLLFGYECIG